MIETMQQRIEAAALRKAQKELLLQALQDQKQREHGLNVQKHLRAIQHGSLRKPNRPNQLPNKAHSLGRSLNKPLRPDPSNQNWESVAGDPSIKLGRAGKVWRGAVDGRERSRKWRAKKREEINRRNRERMRVVRAVLKAKRKAEQGKARYEV